jgi:hypothetical protein
MNQNPSTPEIELERRILHGLACEWEAALWVLEEKLRHQMKRPLFSIRDMTHAWGLWSGRNREVRISRSLVLNHPWDAVREVLLHEMAHQLAEQVLGADGEPPHGPVFRKACHLLRADPKASGMYPLLQERIHSGAEDGNDRIRIRIKKLLALAQSQYRHEAEAAMVKAHELMIRHNIDRNPPERNLYVSLFLSQPALRHPREAYHLAGLLHDFYFVQGIWVPAYVISRAKMGRVLEVSGTPQNVVTAEYVYHFVSRYIDREWSVYNPHRRLHRNRKTDFAVGIIEGFRKKLAASRPEILEKVKGRQLIPIEDRQLKAYMRYKYPRTRSFRQTGGKQDGKVLEDGFRIGEKLILSKGVTERKEGPTLILDF